MLASDMELICIYSLAYNINLSLSHMHTFLLRVYSKDKERLVCCSPRCGLIWTIFQVPEDTCIDYNAFEKSADLEQTAL